MKTNDLIPIDGIYISETYFPKGYLVGRYDREGLVADQRWFETLDKAKAHAATAISRAALTWGTEQ